VHEYGSRPVHGTESQKVKTQGNSGALTGAGLETSDEPNYSIGHWAAASNFMTNVCVMRYDIEQESDSRQY
jgi:hypothetical protein